MAGTMTWVGMDVHARLTHAVAIDAMTGELVRRKFGPGVDEVVGWLQGLPGPVRACYEAGLTGIRVVSRGDRGRYRDRGDRSGQDTPGSV
jgi:hypothetical protein